MATPSSSSLPGPASNTAAPSGGFDDVLTQLRGVVEKLESGQLGLEASLGAFEQGVALAREGAKILDEAERRVEILTRTPSGNPSGNSDSAVHVAPFSDEGP